MLCGIFASTPRPVDEDGEIYMRAIYFDAKRDAPEIFWIRPDDDTSWLIDKIIDDQELEDYLSDKSHMNRSCYIYTWPCSSCIFLAQS